ncbi:MAG: flagellar basal body rod C-terminal domain-containing protein [Sulfurospirillaceae bacterium]|nr:flagellar basal body rod C-terminal domain-containing protein [Sulfurospirillaceae bacterium]MDD3462916.1 flagellar basal body rod C-terminal domain-containing protein [Sulfurospirillaceae bacterium]
MQINANSMMANVSWMDNSASNVANVGNSDYKALNTTLQSSDSSVSANSSQSDTRTDLAKESTEQIVVEKNFEANAQAIKAQDEMIGSLLDLTI